MYEVEKFLSHKYLRPLQYNGNPIEREKLRQRFKRHNLIVASYDIVRKDITFFSNIKWNYIILDEGHIIKNGKTRTSIAIKNLVANHRLILSGTPIQVSAHLFFYLLHITFVVNTEQCVGTLEPF